MKSIIGWGVLAMSIPGLAIAAGDAAKGADADRLRPAAQDAVQLEGFLGRQIDLCIEHRIMAQPVAPLVKPFAEKLDGKDGFRGEFWGKWMCSAALAYGYAPNEAYREIIDDAVTQLLATQAPDGYIGTYVDGHHLGTWDVWSRKYVMLGLLHYYEQTGEARALEAACEEADSLIAEAGPGKTNLTGTGYPDWEGLPPSSVLEPIALLYRITGEQRYLDFAEHIVSLWSQPNDLVPNGLRLIERALEGIPAKDIAAPKAYELMSCYEGLCELYRATGEARYKDAALALGQSIRETERMIVGSGANHELWIEGVKYQTEIVEQPLETCVTTTWMKLCEQLLRLTGDPVWADEMELSLYNALLGAMTPEGDWWAYYCPLIGERVPSHAQYPDVGLSCCVANGPRGLLHVPRWAVMQSDDGLAVNLYAPGTAKMQLDDGTPVELVQETSYPEQDAVRITVNPAEAVDFALSLRIPAWSKQTKLTVNGEPHVAAPGTYTAISRAWKPGDQVELKLDLRGRVIDAPSGAPQKAIMRGPVVLALDSRLVAPRSTAVRLLHDEDGYVPLTPIEAPENIWMAFKAPFQIHILHVFFEDIELALCDSRSAGNAWSEDNQFRVWLPQPLHLEQPFPKKTWRLQYPPHPISGIAEPRPEIPPQFKAGSAPAAEGEE